MLKPSAVRFESSSVAMHVSTVTFSGGSGTTTAKLARPNDVDRSCTDQSWNLLLRCTLVPKRYSCTRKSRTCHPSASPPFLILLKCTLMFKAAERIPVRHAQQLRHAKGSSTHKSFATKASDRVGSRREAHFN